MRVPLDRSLASWIRELESQGRMYVFYKTPEWRRLRAEVLSDNRNECRRCGERGRYSRATVVHHVNEVLKRPDLALTRWVKDRDGNMVENLIPLCFGCHEEEHGRPFKGNTGRKEGFTNEERW